MDREYHRDYSREYYHKRKQEIIEKMGGKCVCCGSVTDLQFDHIIPTTKSFPISKLLNFSKKKIDEEILKCQLLCKECHLNKSRIDWSISNGGTNNANAVFSEAQVIELREEFSNIKFNVTEKAEEYNVTPHCMSNMLRGITYNKIYTGFEEGNTNYLKDIGNR